MRIRSVLAAGAATALIAVTAAPAQAVATVDDPYYDVDSSNATAAMRAHVDLDYGTMWRSSGRAYFRWKVRDLQQMGGTNFVKWDGEYRISDGTYRGMSVYYRSGWGGYAGQMRFDGTVARTCGTASMVVAKSFTSNYLTISFPEACFPNGKTVYDTFFHKEIKTSSGWAYDNNFMNLGPAFTPNPA